MVLSVQVYYYKIKNITTFKIDFFECFNSKSLELFDYIVKIILFVKFVIFYFILGDVKQRV